MADILEIAITGISQQVLLFLFPVWDSVAPDVDATILSSILGTEHGGACATTTLIPTVARNNKGQTHTPSFLEKHKPFLSFVEGTMFFTFYLEGIILMPQGGVGGKQGSLPEMPEIAGYGSD